MDGAQYMAGAGVDAAVEHLLVESLAAWRITGEVRRKPDGSLLLTASDRRLRVARAESNLPFRWMVSDGERNRGVTGIAGLLRAVRSAVDPGYRPVRLRIAPSPLVPP